MIVFPNCKINLGLYVVSKREDGYHDIQTIFYPVPFRDMLEFIPSQTLTFDQTGLPIPGKSEDNLCMKAYHLLKKRFPELPPLHIHLHKIIPLGGGLGGGSSDAAFLLTAINTYFRLGLKQDELITLSLQLGSDCPFFMRNEPVFATGRGEIMQPVPLDLQRFTLVLALPGIHISTAEAFQGITPANPEIGLDKAIMQPVEDWRNWLRNDFEENIFSKYPAIAALKQWMYDHGATYAAMTGTGSTVYGLFESSALPDFPKDLALFLAIPLKKD